MHTQTRGLAGAVKAFHPCDHVWVSLISCCFYLHWHDYFFDIAALGIILPGCIIWVSGCVREKEEERGGENTTAGGDMIESDLKLINNPELLFSPRRYIHNIVFRSLLEVTHGTASWFSTLLERVLTFYSAGQLNLTNTDSMWGWGYVQTPLGERWKEELSNDPLGRCENKRKTLSKAALILTKPREAAYSFNNQLLSFSQTYHSWFHPRFPLFFTKPTWIVLLDSKLTYTMLANDSTCTKPTSHTFNQQ